MSGSRKNPATVPGALKFLAAVLVAGYAPPAGAMQAGGVGAALDPISAQRPGNQGTEPVAQGLVQLEFGYAFERDNSEGTGVSTHTIPDLLLIFGVSERFDLRVSGTGFVHVAESSTGQGSVDGTSDLTIGSLVRLVDQMGWRPAIGILPSIAVPTGTREMTAGEIEPGVIFASSWAATDAFGITWNLVWHSVAPASADAQRHEAFGTVLDLEFGLTERLGLWAEHFAEHSTDPETGTGQRAAVGVSYGLRDSVNVDASTAFGLSGSTSDFMGTVGMSLRWPLFR